MTAAFVILAFLAVSALAILYRQKDKSQGRIQQLRAVAAIGRKALKGGDLQSLFDETTILLAKELRAHYSKILQVIDDDARVLMVSGYGWKSGVVGQWTDPLGPRNMNSYVLSQTKPVLVGKLADEKRFDPPAFLLEHGVTSCVCVTIDVEGRRFGILQADTKQRRYFNEDDVWFLEAMAVVLSDAIRRRWSEERLKRSNTELEQFASVASHDLQEPIRKILSFSERLEGEAAESGRRGEYLEKIKNAGNRMHHLVQNLLTFSKTADSPQLENVDLNLLIKDAVSELDLRIQESGAEVSAGPLPSIRGNYAQLHQLFTNLLSNSIKYSRAGTRPRIAIASGESEGFYEIRVSDNGIGFDSRHGEEIFRPFTRLHGKSEYEGTGLGLAICKRIVEKHGGKIRAESAGPGLGAAFIICLPKAATR